MSLHIGLNPEPTPMPGASLRVRSVSGALDLHDWEGQITDLRDP